MFGTVGTVGESLAARRILAKIGFLSSVGPQMDLQVLQARESLQTSVVLHKCKTGGGNKEFVNIPFCYCVRLMMMHSYRAAIGFLARVDAHVNQQLVAGVKRSVSARTAGPEACEIFRTPLVYVTALYVLD